jgi:hypothetical protein
MNREDIIRMARLAGISNYGLTGWTCWPGQLERFAALVADAEREACAKVVEGINPDHQDCNHYDRFIAAAIRARGEK